MTFSLSHRLRLLLLGLSLLLKATSPGHAQSGALDKSFSPTTGPDSLVYAVATQPDGKIVIGGQFTSVNSTNRPRVARLNANGSLDLGFGTTAGVNDAIYALAIQPDGRVLIGGQFTTVNGTTRPAIARLTTNGLFDTTFDVGSGPGGFFPTIYSIVVLPDGRILLGGSFTGFNGASVDNLAMINPSGSLDAGFKPDSIDSSVDAIALQPDGKIVIGGDFTQVAFETHNYIARLFPAGALDRSFGSTSSSLGPDSSVITMALQPDGKIVIGGYFGNVDGVARRYLARLTTDGKLDTGFNSGTGPDSNPSALTLQSDGKIYVGGLFISFNGTNRGGIARLNPSGGLDTTFNSNPGASGSVRGIAVQSDGKVVIGGGFPSYNGSAFGNVARVIGDSILEFTASGFFAFENGGTATANVRRLGDTNSTVTVNFATSNVTAVAGQDYTATNGTLTFTPGQTLNSFTVPITNDGLPEYNEVFQVRLSNSSPGARLGTVTNVNVAIIETNSTGTIQFDTNSFRVSESSGAVKLIVHRTGGGTGPQSVDFTTVSGNALAGSDFIATNGTLMFAPSDAFLTITVPIVDNWPTEGDEAFSVRLSSPVGAVLGTYSNATITIVDSALSYEDLYGHMLRIEKSELVYAAQFSSSFSNRVTVRNPAPGTSLPGTVRLTSLDPAFTLNFALAAIPGGSTASVIVGGPANFVPGCDFNNPPGSCSNLFFATVYEPTTNGLIAQDSRMVFTVTNTQPPTGGVPVGGGGGLPAPGFSPPPFMTNVLITGPTQIDEDAFGDFAAAALLSNGTTNSGVIPAWSSSTFGISDAGRLTTSEVSSNTSVRVSATVILGTTNSATNVVTVLDLPQPRITNAIRSAGNFGFTITGSPNRRYAVDRSSSLATSPPWTALNTNAANGSGTLQFSEPIAPGARFFRARRVP